MQALLVLLYGRFWNWFSLYHRYTWLFFFLFGCSTLLTFTMFLRNRCFFKWTIPSALLIVLLQSLRFAILIPFFGIILVLADSILKTNLFVFFPTIEVHFQVCLTWVRLSKKSVLIFKYFLSTLKSLSKQF